MPALPSQGHRYRRPVPQQQQPSEEEMKDARGPLAALSARWQAQPCPAASAIQLERLSRQPRRSGCGASSRPGPLPDVPLAVRAGQRPRPTQRWTAWRSLTGTCCKGWPRGCTKCWTVGGWVGSTGRARCRVQHAYAEAARTHMHTHARACVRAYTCQPWSRPAAGTRSTTVNVAPPGRLPWEVLEVDEETPMVGGGGGSGGGWPP